MFLLLFEMMMTKTILLTVLFCITIEYCQAWNDTESRENRSEIINPFLTNQSFANYGRYHPRHRRQSDEAMANPDTASLVLSILPLDRIGTMLGQMLGTGLKEVLNPNVGKKLINVLETQAPLVLTSLFTNLYSTLRVPVRSSSSTTTNLTGSSLSMSNNPMKLLTNGSSSQIINSIRGQNRK